MSGNVSEEAPSGRPRWSARALLTGLLLLWAATIFTTSCFFIHRDTFIRFIGGGLPAGVVRNSWSALWMVAGLFFVKGYHMAEYALLYGLLFFVIRTHFGWSVGPTTRVGIVCCVLYAASDEWHQTFVPGRGGTVVDVAIDSAGVAIAAAVVARRCRHRAG